MSEIFLFKNKFASVNLLKFSYDTAKWDFRKDMELFFNYSSLERLQDRDTPNDVSLDVYAPAGEVSAITKKGLILSEMLYKHFPVALLDKFSDFIYEVLPDLVGPVINHQRVPMVRIHLDGSQSISDFHRDSEAGQKSSTLNLWMPFTEVWGNNSIWIESEVGMDDPTPVMLSYGEAIIFRAADLLHGSVFNNTGHSRVSCDIRLITLGI